MKLFNPLYLCHVPLFKKITLAAFLLLKIISVSAQNNYDDAILLGEQALTRGEFKKALKLYFAAEAFNPEKRNEIELKINQLFDQIQILKDQAIEQRAVALQAKLRADSASVKAQRALDSLKVVNERLEVQSKKLNKAESELTSQYIERKAKESLSIVESLLTKKQFIQAKGLLWSTYNQIRDAPLPSTELIAIVQNKISTVERVLNLKDQFNSLIEEADSLVKFDLLSAYSTYEEAGNRHFDDQLVEGKQNNIKKHAKSSLSLTEALFFDANIYHIENDTKSRDQKLGLLLHKDVNFSLHKDNYPLNLKFLPEVEQQLIHVKKKRKINNLSVKIGIIGAIGQQKVFKDGSVLETDTSDEKVKRPSSLGFSINYELLLHPKWSLGLKFSGRVRDRDSFRVKFSPEEGNVIYGPILNNRSKYLSLFIGRHFPLTYLPGAFYINAGAGFRFSRLSYKLNGNSISKIPDIGDKTIRLALNEEKMNHYRTRDPFFDLNFGLSGIFPRDYMWATLFLEAGISWSPNLGTDPFAYTKKRFNDIRAFEIVRISNDRYLQLSEVPVPTESQAFNLIGDYSFEKSDLSILISTGIMFNF